MRLTPSCYLALLLTLTVFLGSSSFAQQQFANQLNVAFVGDPHVELAAKDAVVIAGNTTDGLLVVKINQNGQPLWHQRFSDDSDSLIFGCLRLRNQKTAWVGYRKDKELGVIKLSDDGSVAFNKLYPSPPSVSEPHQPEAIVFTSQTVEILYRDIQSSGRFVIAYDGTFRNAFGTGRDSLSNASAVAESFQGGYIQAFGNQINYNDPSNGTLLRDKRLKPPFQQVIDLAAGNEGDHFYALISKSQDARSFIVAKFQFDRSAQKPLTVKWQSQKIRTRSVGRLKAEALEVRTNGQPLIVGKANTGDLIPHFRPAVIHLSEQGKYQQLKILSNPANPAKSFSSGTDVVYDSTTHTHWLVGYEGSEELNRGKGMVASWGERLDTQFCVDTLSYITETTAQLQIESRFKGSVPNDLYGDTAIQTSVNTSPLEITRICKKCDQLRLELFQDTTICQNESIQVSTAYPMAKHQWTGLEDTGHEVTIAKRGSYQVRASNGCHSDTASFTIRYYKPPDPVIEIRPKALKPGDSLFIAQRNQVIKQESWHYKGLGTPLEGANQAFTVEDTGKLNLTLDYSGPEGCAYQDTIGAIRVYPFSLYVPNAFSPNNQGPNETFQPYGEGIQDYRLSIYNRWGSLIYKGKNKPWDGRYKGQLVGSGFYLYKLKVVSQLGEVVYRNGTLTVIR